MQFRWAAAIALWALLVGPVFAPADRTAAVRPDAPPANPAAVAAKAK